VKEEMGVGVRGGGVKRVECGILALLVLLRSFVES
jgi:hypothetical protein